jgi:hypothetical protein
MEGILFWKYVHPPHTKHSNIQCIFIICSLLIWKLYKRNTSNHRPDQQHKCWGLSSRRGSLHLQAPSSPRRMSEPTHPTTRHIPGDLSPQQYYENREPHNSLTCHMLEFTKSPQNPKYILFFFQQHSPMTFLSARRIKCWDRIKKEGTSNMSPNDMI